MTQISVQGSLSDPPVFGDCVRMLIGGPLMVVVDANPPPPGSDRTSCVAVCYLDDCALLHSDRVPWGLLEPCSVELLAKEHAERCQELDVELSARETTRTNARLKVIHEAVASSSDPASLFGLLRNAVLSVLRAGFEVDDRGSPEDVASREDTDLGASLLAELVKAPSGAPEVLRSGTYETEPKAVSSADEPTVLERLCGRPHRSREISSELPPSDDPLAGRGGEPMACLSSSEVSGATVTDSNCEAPISASDRPFTTHTHF